MRVKLFYENWKNGTQFLFLFFQIIVNTLQPCPQKIKNIPVYNYMYSLYLLLQSSRQWMCLFRLLSISFFPSKHRSQLLFSFLPFTFRSLTVEKTCKYFVGRGSDSYFFSSERNWRKICNEKGNILFGLSIIGYSNLIAKNDFIFDNHGMWPV